MSINRRSFMKGLAVLPAAIPLTQPETVYINYPEPIIIDPNDICTVRIVGHPNIPKPSYSKIIRQQRIAAETHFNL